MSKSRQVNGTADASKYIDSIGKLLAVVIWRDNTILIESLFWFLWYST